jgi:hypothetical protein
VRHHDKKKMTTHSELLLEEVKQQQMALGTKGRQLSDRVPRQPYVEAAAAVAAIMVVKFQWCNGSNWTFEQR